MQARILVVDDDEGARRLIEMVLLRAGYAVRVAGDDEQALRIFSAEPAELLVIDKNLPGATGFDVITQLRAIYPDLPAIVITAFPEPVLFRVPKIQGYLAKPFERLSILTETVAGVLTQRSRLIEAGLARPPPAGKPAQSDGKLSP